MQPLSSAWNRRAEVYQPAFGPHRDQLDAAGPGLQGYAMQFRPNALAALPWLAITLSACGATAPPGSAPAASPSTSTCLPGARGFLEARLKGEIDTALQWRGETLQCEGGPRPEGRGLRVSVLGRSEATGQSARIRRAIRPRRSRSSMPIRSGL